MASCIVKDNVWEREVWRIHLAPAQVGYDVLLRNQSVFQCYYDLRDTIFHSELGSTLAIFGAGYTIDSLMLRYQGVDWRNKDNWGCNGGCAGDGGMLCGRKVIDRLLCTGKHTKFNQS